MRNHSTTKVAQARLLRQNATEAERKLWSHLRKKQMGGLRFRRQHPLGPYIADFFCGPARLVVELDGGQHGEDQNDAYDHKRTQWIEAQGYRVVRYSNSEFFRDPDEALRAIWHVIEESGAVSGESGPR